MKNNQYANPPQNDYILTQLPHDVLNVILDKLDPINLDSMYRTNNLLHCLALVKRKNWLYFGTWEYIMNNCYKRADAWVQPYVLKRAAYWYVHEDAEHGFRIWLRWDTAREVLRDTGYLLGGSLIIYRSMHAAVCDFGDLNYTQDRIYMPDIDDEVSIDNTDLKVNEGMAVRWMVECERKVKSFDLCTVIPVMNKKWCDLSVDLKQKTLLIMNEKNRIKTSSEEVRFKGGILNIPNNVRKVLQCISRYFMLILALSLIRSNSCPHDIDKATIKKNDLFIPTKATLIVTRATNLKFWSDALDQYSSDLKVLTIRGVRDTSKITWGDIIDAGI